MQPNQPRPHLADATRTGLSTPTAIVWYVGALLGPSLLLVPGLAVSMAGPASVLVWVALLGVSGVLAAVFLALGRRYPSVDGMAGYVRGALGASWPRVVRWWFVAGALIGAPVVSLAGGAYVGSLLGVGLGGSALLAGALMLVVVLMRLAGGRVGSGLQLWLVAVMVAVVVVAVVGSAPQARAENWTPFLPHGWGSLGRTAVPLMMCFVGWEAISPMIGQLRDPQRQLPRVFGASFAITGVIYLALAVGTVAVLGTTAGEAPIAGLLDAALGRPGHVLAAVVAVAVTLAATNAYLSGAASLIDSALGRPLHPTVLPLTIAVVAALVLTVIGTGVFGVAALVSLPSALFLAVYLITMVAAGRLLPGAGRVAAAVGVVTVTVLLLFSGPAIWAPAAVAGVAVVTAAASRRRGSAAPRPPARRPRGRSVPDAPCAVGPTAPGGDPAV